MKKNNGFSLIEVLVAFSILFMAATTLIPIISLLNYELEVLSERREISNRLHDELQTYLWNNKTNLPLTYSKSIEGKSIIFHISTEDNLIKGCVEWNNVKQTKEEFCLYGYPS